MARSWSTMAPTSSANFTPRTCARCSPTRKQAVSWVRKALVDATAISGPPCV